MGEVCVSELCPAPTKVVIRPAGSTIRTACTTMVYYHEGSLYTVSLGPIMKDPCIQSPWAPS